jgi:hypothetical protein
MAIDKLKTKYSVGTWVNNVKSFFDKINEIIDNINIGSRPYKVLTLKVSQTATDNPTWIVLENTILSDINELNLSRTNPGEYVVNVSDVFKPESKCVAFIGNGKNDSNYNFRIQYNTPTAYIIFTSDILGNNDDSILLDTFVEIRVYN